ncbi:MAG: phage holin [Eubacterium sp.]
MNINLKIRLKSMPFWLGMCSALFVCVNQILGLMGISLDLGSVQEVVNAVLAMLAAYGVLVDPTTPGAGDSSVTLAKKRIEETAADVLAKAGE